MSSGDTVIPSLPEGDFSVEDWAELTNMLRFAEPIFQRIANERNARLLSSARWPELRLKWHTWWTVTELRLSLHPGHPWNQGNGSLWAINLVRYPRFAWLPRGPKVVESVGELTDEELTIEGRVRDRMQVAVRRASRFLEAH